MVNLPYNLTWNPPNTYSTMRQFFHLKPRNPKVPNPGLEPAKVILNFVASLGDGAVGVPGLKAAAQIVIRIIEIAQARV